MYVKRFMLMAALALIAVLVLAVGCSNDNDGAVVGDDGETTSIVAPPAPPSAPPTTETTVEEPTLPDTSGVV